MNDWKMQFVVSGSSSKIECFEFEMIIENFSKFNGVSNSPSFTTTQNCKTTWQIILEVDNGSGKMRVGLKRTDENICSVKGSMFFVIQNDKKRIYWRDSVESFCTSYNQNYHFFDYIEIPSRQDDVSEISKKVFVLTSDKIIIKGHVSVNKHLFGCPSHQVEVFPNENLKKLKRDYKSLYYNQQLSDVEFRFADGKLLAHKNILSSRSPVFQESIEKNLLPNIIEVADFEKSVFEIFLIFLYSGEIKNRDMDTIIPLYELACKYKVGSLVRTCSSILSRGMSAKTAIRILSLAHKQGDTDLINKSIDFACERFSQVSKTSEWDKLLSSDPRFASTVLRKVSEHFGRYK